MIIFLLNRCEALSLLRLIVVLYINPHHLQLSQSNIKLSIMLYFIAFINNLNTKYMLLTITLFTTGLLTCYTIQVIIDSFK